MNTADRPPASGEPGTEAGRRFVATVAALFIDPDDDSAIDVTEEVCAIEAEARQQDGSALLRALVESNVPKGVHGQGGYYDAREWIAAHDAAVAFLARQEPDA